MDDLDKKLEGVPSQQGVLIIYPSRLSEEERRLYEFLHVLMPEEHVHAPADLEKKAAEYGEIPDDVA